MQEKNTINSELTRIHIGDDVFYKISNSDAMRPFFMSIVSDSNHWMFISSNGGLTAGRKNAQFSLFPYYTDDKITESIEVTGSKTILRVKSNGDTLLWEPFSDRLYGVYNITRNLYKSIYGNKILFEEINHDLGLTFSYEWNSSNVYGFVRKSTLKNHGKENLEISLIDGIQNVLPYGVGSDLQNRQSNLVDAYKRTELDKSSGLGIFALSAIIVDKAEPSEALKANVAWSLGMENATHLLSSLQLNGFRKGEAVHEETDIKAEKGAYLLQTELTLVPGDEKKWMIVANVNQDHSAVAELSKAIKENDQLLKKVEQDVEHGTQQLIQLNASSDGLQYTRDQLRDTRHFSNTLFNIMRGGIFDDNYNIEKWDFKKYLRKANKNVFAQFEKNIEALPEVFSLSELKTLSASADDNNFKRLCLEYMPLKFSRRHGDPSRPWNVFSINTMDEADGSKILDYEGNWRDIFQNWEALALSYPEFIESMIHKFLNATTFDGYNPYRVTKDGFDWEVIEPDDPWSYIGYWGDHQLIYLLKFLEFAEDLAPGRLESYFNQDIFVYANVPYKIKGYADLLKDPKDTIEFDEALDHKIRTKRDQLGADGALIYNAANDIYRVNFVEKILATVLAKISNFIPEGGIWMNTQRPEWNDANNALVGNGVSMVTLYYLRRFLNFLKDLFQGSNASEVEVSKELIAFFQGVVNTLKDHQSVLNGTVSDRDRRKVLDGLGQAGSDYRAQIYGNPFSGDKESVSMSDLMEFVEISMKYCEHAIKANRREDSLYHAYNLMTVENGEEVSISYLSEMLEGQVAALSSGALTSEEALDLLDGLKNSDLFRADQYSYLLYPNKRLPLFTEKNTLPGEAVAQSALIQELLEKGNGQIVKKDINNKVHFNGNFKNANDLSEALNALDTANFTSLNEEEKNGVLGVFEQIFNHKAFTGRSGTFFGYEGLGSIYWHMVSKLLLAVQEVCITAIEQDADPVVVGKLLEHYYEINEGIGVHKSPALYGAFSTDPYSHTPEGKGAQQPGMTGQVKEDILSRFGELGVFIRNGKLCFDPCLLRKSEFLEVQKPFTYVSLEQKNEELLLEPGSICFTYCQVPVIYQLADEEGMEISYNNGSESTLDSLELDTENSRRLFERTGEIKLIRINLKEGRLR